jgi:hypothetical protein
MVLVTVRDPERAREVSWTARLDRLVLEALAVAPLTIDELQECMRETLPAAGLAPAESVDRAWARRTLTRLAGAGREAVRRVFPGRAAPAPGTLAGGEPVWVLTEAGAAELARLREDGRGRG